MKKGGESIFSVHPRLYKQKGARFAKKQFMEDKAYVQTVTCKPIVCVDTVFVSIKHGLMFLARRKAEPMSNWWYTGGGVKAGEPELKAACRTIKRETTLNVKAKRLVPITMRRYFFNSRQQRPRTLGCDSVCYQFMLDISQRELDIISANLDKHEYEEGGLRSFDRRDLATAKVDQSVIDMYDLIFNRSGSVIGGGRSRGIVWDDSWKNSGSVEMTT